MKIAVLVILFSTAGIFGCGGSQSPAASADESGSPAPAGETDTSQGAARSELTAEACEAGGGSVVGDIGDGAIHKPDYKCPSGDAPTGNIRAADGGPMGVEGSVCCPK